MKTLITSVSAIICLNVFAQPLFAQDCKTTAELDEVPGKYLTAAQYPWPAARNEYFSKMTNTSDKSTAKITLERIEKIEQESRAGFRLTGGNWENVFSSKGYEDAGGTKLGVYYFQSALYEYFCGNGKLVRNSEFSTLLRIYVNTIPFNTLNKFIRHPFGNSIGNDYDFGFQFSDWRNHNPVDVNARLIKLFTFSTCNNAELIATINSGRQYFQDIADKDIKPNSRSIFVYRYWFIKKDDLPVLVPVSRKEYLQSLLEYYEREQLHFEKLVRKLSSDRDPVLKRYGNWKAEVNEKIAIVKTALNNNAEEWLAKQAIVNKAEDIFQNNKARLTEQTNNNRFWKFYDNEKKSEPLYKYNPVYFIAGTKDAASPQLITVAFRYVTIPSSIRILENFTKNFNFGKLKSLL